MPTTRGGSGASLTRAAQGSRSHVTQDAGSPDLPRTFGIHRAKALFMDAVETGGASFAHPNANLQAALTTLASCTADPCGSVIEAALSLPAGASFADAVAAVTA